RAGAGIERGALADYRGAEGAQIKKRGVLAAVAQVSAKRHRRGDETRLTTAAADGHRPVDGEFRAAGTHVSEGPAAVDGDAAGRELVRYQAVQGDGAEAVAVSDVQRPADLGRAGPELRQVGALAVVDRHAAKGLVPSDCAERDRIV